MQKRVIRYGFVTVALFAAACLIPASITAQERYAGLRSGLEGSFDRTLTVSGTVDLDVSTGSGSIDIKRGAGNRVEIHGRIRAGESWFRSSRDAEDTVRRLEANPPIEQSGSTIRVGRTTDRDWMRNVSISYQIVLPSPSNVRAHSGSGSQSLDGISGRVEANTGSGSITLRDINGDLDASTGSGTIRAMGIRGGLRMHTGSGGIQVQGEQTAQWELGTGSGRIDIDLPPNAGFEFTGHTGSGGIDVGYPMTVQGRISGNRHNLAGKVGAGGYRLVARTGSGHIRIQ